MAANLTVTRAIETSTHEHRIVHLEEEPGLLDSLFAESEDNAEDGAIREFWGTTDDGSEWRIHVTVA